MSVDQPFNTYREQLSSHHGLALWDPKPAENIYKQPGHVSIGDVGYLDNGAFMRMFNVTLPWDDPSNKLLGKPGKYEVIEPSHLSNVRDNEIREGEYYTPHVSKVDNVGVDTHEDSIGQMYQCKAHHRGALLSLPEKGRRKDVISIKVFENYIRDNIDNWFRWSKEMMLPVDHMEDLILITGCTLVTSWAAAAFDGHMSVDSDATTISLKARKSGGGRTQFFWRDICGNVEYHNSRFDQNVQEPVPQDQCVFIRGFRAKRTFFRTRPMRAAAEPLPVHLEDRREDDIQVTQIPDSSKYRDPLAGVLDYIVENCREDASVTQDIIAIAHDDDLQSIEGVETLTADAVQNFLRSKKVPLLIENGAAILRDQADHVSDKKKATFYAPHSPSPSMLQWSSTVALAKEQADWQSDLQIGFRHLLKPAVDSRFRILLIGRSGVGKSNLINSIFKGDFTTVEHGRKAGVSDIEQEITSPQNPRLVLHDSQGFTLGSGDNFNIVKNFIETRNQTKNLKDRLHAIWLCSAVPTYGGILLEVGEIEILHIAKDCNVPIVAVFTKYDLLVESLKPQYEEDLYGDIERDIENLEEVDPDTGLNIGTSAHQIDPDLLSSAEAKLDEMIEPFEEVLRDIRWVKVSVLSDLSETLDELVDVTQQCINKKSLEVLWVVTQQQSEVPKIKASIESVQVPIGTIRYWRGLSTSLKHPSGGKWFKKWFEVIHRDIVTIWDIYDPKNVLTSTTEEISKLQQDLLESGPNILRGMMARTGTSGSRSPVDKELFKLALDAYKQDSEHSLQKVHQEIRSFATWKNALSKSARGRVIKEIERLITVHRSKSSERFVVDARP